MDILIAAIVILVVLVAGISLVRKEAGKPRSRVRAWIGGGTTDDLLYPDLDASPHDAGDSFDIHIGD